MLEHHFTTGCFTMMGNHFETTGELTIGVFYLTTPANVLRRNHCHFIVSIPCIVRNLALISYLFKYRYPAKDLYQCGVGWIAFTHTHPLGYSYPIKLMHLINVFLDISVECVSKFYKQPKRIYQEAQARRRCSNKSKHVCMGFLN